MGYGGWSDDADRVLRSSYSTKSTDDIFHHTKSDTVSNEMSPEHLVLRESRDSEEHPNSIPVMIALDVTGSMSTIPNHMVREHLPKLMTTMLKHELPDVQVLFLAVGDHECDRHPLQVGQFESGTEEINKWLTETNLEGGGGPNYGESYFLAHLVAARFTSIDSFEKRGKKGFLFTIGDEPCLNKLFISDVCDEKLKAMLKEAQIETLDAKAIIEEAQRTYHVFHVQLDSRGSSKWKDWLGQNVIEMDKSDVANIAEVIASTVALVNGADLADITKDFDDKTALTVSTALANIDSRITKAGKEDGIIVI